MKSYCIREDYESRTEAETYVDDPNEYWNEQRIFSSGIFQYYVYKKAADLAGKIENCSLIDIGCGYPTKTHELISPVVKNITLLDQPSMQGLLEEEFPDMKFLPLNLAVTDQAPKAKFDCVICSDVIEHLLEPDLLLALIRELLAPNGIAVISTPERNILRGPNCLRSPNAKHVREWNKAEFGEYLRLSGFDVLEHSLLPNRRVSRLQELALPLTRHLKYKQTSGCQTAVCIVK